MGASKDVQARKICILEGLLICLQHVLVVAKLKVYLHNLLKRFETPAITKVTFMYTTGCCILFAKIHYHSALSGSILTTS